MFLHPSLGSNHRELRVMRDVHVTQYPLIQILAMVFRLLRAYLMEEVAALGILQNPFSAIAVRG